MAKTNLQGALQFNRRQIQEVIDREGFVLAARKIDGVRAEIIVAPDGHITVLSRAGKPLPALQAFFDDTIMEEQHMAVLSYFPEGVRLDVEVTLDGYTFQEGCGLLRTSTPKKLALIDYSKIRLWPIGVILPNPNAAYEDRQAWGVSLVQLFAAAVGFQVGSMIVWHLRDFEAIERTYQEQRALGFEGLMVYDPKGTAKVGKVLGWWKVKPEEEADGIITDLIEGEGRLKGTMGAAMVKLEDGTVCKVGTGWTDEQRAALWSAFTGGKSFFKWSRYIQITYMERTDDGNIRHPAFDRFRDVEGQEGVKT